VPQWPSLPKRSASIAGVVWRARYLPNANRRYGSRFTDFDSVLKSLIERMAHSH